MHCTTQYVPNSYDKQRSERKWSGCYCYRFVNECSVLMNERFKAAATICLVFSRLDSNRVAAKRGEEKGASESEFDHSAARPPPMYSDRTVLREWNATLCASAILKWSEAKWSKACDQHRSAWEHSSAVQYSTVPYSTVCTCTSISSAVFSSVLFSAVSSVRWAQ